jgi:hypothetical protein
MADGTIKDTQATTSLYAALAKAQAMVHGIEKDARNQFHKYNYVSAEMMIREAKEILSAHHLALIPTGSTLDGPIALGETDSDYAKNARCAGVIRASWLVVHKDGGSHAMGCDWPVAPEKGRPIDKAVAAARTASLSYLLRDLLQIPRVEEGTDLDHDSRDPPQHQQRERAPVTIQDDLRQAIGHELDRMGKKGSERTRLVVEAVGHQPETVADLQKALAVLKGKPDAKE